MPFIIQEQRSEIDRLGLVACKEVGDVCYVFYRHMVSIWKKEPRWRTVHQLYKDLVLDWETNEFYLTTRDTLIYRFSDMDILTACHLAWQMFMVNYVLEYEKTKEIQNGSI